LLSGSFRFSHTGGVRLRVGPLFSQSTITDMRAPTAYIVTTTQRPTAIEAPVDFTIAATTQSFNPAAHFVCHLNIWMD
jgi:hypothetical protein